MHSEKTNKIIELCEEGTTAVTEYKTSKGKMTLKCKNGHLRDITPEKLIARGDKRKCKECDTYKAANRKTTEEFAQQCLDKGVTLLENYVDNNTRLLIRNNTCGHEYTVNPNSLVTKGSGSICRVCNPVVNKKQDEVLDTLKTKYSLVPTEEYLGVKYKTMVTNTICNHSYFVDISSIIYKDTGYICPVCGISKGLLSREEITDKLAVFNLTPLEDYKGVKYPLLVRNSICGHEYYSDPNNLFYKSLPHVCKVCHPNVSAEEQSLRDFVSIIYKDWVIYGDRIMLEGKELDIILPDVGLAFEYNGDYWHRETEVRDKYYHLNKLIAVESYEYQLIHIKGLLWNTKPSIVKSRIKSILGIFDKRIYARNTIVKQLDYFPREFLDNNHLQGSGSPTGINFGLFLGEQLIACMTFAKPRFSKEYAYELIRFCSLLNYSIVGGASKLLKAFRKSYSGSIISYADRSWSKGTLYSNLGFTFKKYTEPNYTYIKGHKVLSRYQCQKHLLKEMFPDTYADELTEKEIMSKNGFICLYDCGSSVWVLT